jgi:hypothetical protein
MNPAIGDFLNGFTSNNTTTTKRKKFSQQKRRQVNIGECNGGRG